MKLGKAKEFFHYGLIKSFSAVRRPMASGWILEIDGVKGSQWILKKADGEFREFRSIDSLVATVEAITNGQLKGFKVL